MNIHNGLLLTNYNIALYAISAYDLAYDLPTQTKQQKKLLKGEKEA